MVKWNFGGLSSHCYSMQLETSRELDSNGRLQIPQLFLDRLNARPGERLEIKWDDDKKEMIVTFDATPYLEERIKNDKEEELLTSQSESSILYTDWSFPVIKTSTPYPKDFDMVASLKETREERSDKVGGLK